MPTDRLTGPSVVGLVGDMTGPSLWRCLQPISALERIGYPCGWDHTTARLASRLAAHAEMTLLFRVSWPSWSRRVISTEFAAARAAGRSLVIDADDDLYSPEFSARQIEAGWAEGKSYAQLEAERHERLWALGQADGVTVSTEPLAEIVRGFTDSPVHVVPNAIDIPWFRSVVRRRTREYDGVTIGWAGGKRPDGDLEAMAVAWGRIARRYPDVRFVVAGYLPPIVMRHAPADRLHVIPWLPLERYPEAMAHVDIACCAVRRDRFNVCKTPIKAWEAAVAGSCVVATPTLYGGEIVDGETGLLAETTDDWEAALADLVERPARRRILATRLLKHVERRCSLRENVFRWPRAWSAIRDHAQARGVA